MGELLCEVMRPRVDIPLYQADIFQGPFPSGAPAILIDTVARLGHSAGIVGGVGKDDFGKCLLDRLNKDGEYAILTGNGNIFETAWYMTGLENMLCLLLTEPELVNRLFEKVTDYYIGFFRKTLAAAKGRIDIVFTADDIGQQNGLMFSLPLWEELIKPHHVRLNKTLHEFGVKIMYHSDGAVMDAMDGLVDMGIDVLEAIQFDAKGMDPVKLKNGWGEKISFHGGISVQSTLPFGKPDDVRREVRERISVMGKKGGYIIAPSHAIQGQTPPENIAAFFEEAGRPLISL